MGTPPTLEEIKESVKGKPGRPKGSRNKNFEYKRKEREREKAVKLA